MRGFLLAALLVVGLASLTDCQVRDEDFTITDRKGKARRTENDNPKR